MKNLKWLVFKFKNKQLLSKSWVSRLNFDSRSINQYLIVDLIIETIAKYDRSNKAKNWVLI